MIWEGQAETWPYGLEEGMLCGLTCVLQTWGPLGQESDLVTLLLWKDLLGRRIDLDHRRGLRYREHQDYPRGTYIDPIL